MVIAVIADTHDKLATIDLAMEYCVTQSVDLLVHCGDWKSLDTVRYVAQAAAAIGLPVRGVLGNNDLDSIGFMRYAAQAPGDFKLYEGVYQDTFDGRTVAAYHGHHKPTLRKLLLVGHYIVLLGHTHKPLITHVSDGLIINPGSTAFAIPRSKSWRPSIALVDTSSVNARLDYLENNI